MKVRSLWPLEKSLIIWAQRPQYALPGNSHGSCLRIYLGNYLHTALLSAILGFRGQGNGINHNVHPRAAPRTRTPPRTGQRGLYKPAGIACNHCAFTTKKKGFSGRQALRAHLKKHKNNARAWQRPLARQSLLAGFIVALVVLGLVGSGDLRTDLHLALPFGVPLVTLPELVMGWGTVAVAVSLLLSSLYMLTVPGEFGGQPLVRVLLGLRVVGSLLGVWVVVGAWEVVSPG